MRRLLLLLATLLPLASAQSFDPKLYAGLQWRMIGPFRGGRTVGAAGIADQPNVFYIGVNNGGVWKTDDYGRTWNPIFDDQPTGSIGAVALAPSNPNIISRIWRRSFRSARYRSAISNSFVTVFQLRAVLGILVVRSIRPSGNLGRAMPLAK